jgi:thiamine pyrophosphokinase
VQEQRTIVVVGSGSAHPAIAERLVTIAPDAAAVVAADGGVDAAQALGLEVTLAIGDFDSVSPAGLAAAEDAGAHIDRHPSAKDATDLELALDAALELEAGRLVVVASEGGRLDHLLGLLLLLGAERFRFLEVDALVGSARVHVVRGSRTLNGAAGDLVSLLALHGPAEGVTTHGLEYPLDHETLFAGSSRGVSNVFAQDEARVEVAHGVLMAVLPGPEERSE